MKYNKIVNFAIGDVNGDKISDVIIAISQDNDSFQVRNLIIVVQDGKYKNFITYDSKYTDSLYGRSLNLNLQDFDNDGAKDILIHVDTGGVGGAGVHLYKILTLKNNEEDIILGKTEEQMGISVDSCFIDRNNLRIMYKPIRFEYARYLEKNGNGNAELYNGKRIKRPNGGVGIEKFYELIPKDVDNDGVMELIGSQYIYGNGRVDCLGALRSVQKWNVKTKKWDIRSLWVTPGL